MLTSLRALSLPAAYATINSVPPAMGIHSPEPSASRARTSCKSEAAMSSWPSGSPRIEIESLHGRGRYHRFEDLDESRTAAEIARKPLANLVHRRPRIVRQQM